MIQLFPPMSSKDLFTFVVQPYLEGAERLNRAFQGIDFHSLTYASFDWKERLVFLITGIALTLLPLVNLVIWLAWQTFGNPEVLSDPFIPVIPPAHPARIPLAPPPPLLSEAEAVQTKTAAPTKLAAVRPVAAAPCCNKTFSYIESSKSFRTETKWKIEFTSEGTDVVAESDREKTVAKYNFNWEIQDYNCYHKDAELHISLREGRRLFVRGVKEGKTEEREYRLEKPYVWLQQPTLGFKQFIFNKEQKSIYFYAIRPDNLDLVEVIAQKTGESDLEGLIKVEMKMAHFLLRFFREGELWFDPKTSELRKLIDSGRLMETITSEFVQSNLPL